MKIVVAETEGCVGRNLTARLEGRQDVKILSPDEDAAAFLRDLERQGEPCPVVSLSGAWEEEIRGYGGRTGVPVWICRLGTVFGKWCGEDEENIVAKMCRRAARGMSPEPENAEETLRLVYIDDVMEELMGILDGRADAERYLSADGHADVEGYYHIPVETEYEVTVREVSDLLRRFRESRENLMIPDMTEGSFTQKLYATYLSYLPEEGLAYPLCVHADTRGSFTEIWKSADRGQVSVNVIRPGIVKGDHWHHTKNEKFVAVSGKGLIRLRRHGGERVVEYPVDGRRPEVVEIPVGYTHTIVNTGDADLVVLIWCSECFDPERPDTVAEPVERNGKI